MTVLVVGLVVGATPSLRESVTGWVGERRDEVLSRIRNDYVPIAPIEQTATSAIDEFPVEFVVDSNLLTAWVIPADDIEPALVVRFDQAFDLTRIQLWNGTTEGFKDRERVRSLHFVFDTGQTFDLEVKDLPDGQEYSIENGGGVREVEVFITGSYSSLGSDDIALSEIEFLQRR